MSFNLLLVLCSVALLLLPWSSVLVAGQNDGCVFSDPLSIHQSDQVFLEQYVNPVDGTYTMRIRYTGGSSWIGMGVNYNGESQMIPAYAVIGQVKSGGVSSVERYWIDSKSESGLNPLEDVNGHLKSSSFEQLNGESILTFTHDLIILDEDNGSGSVEYEHNAKSRWIWAVGSPDNQWGSHQLRGSFEFALSENCGAVLNETVVTEEPVEEEEIIVDEPTSETEVDDGDGTDQDVTTEPVGQNDGGAPVDVAPAGPANSSSTSSDGNQADDAADDAAKETASDIVFSAENDLEGARSLWNAHGICMGLAWGFFTPLSIGAAILRNMHPILRKSANWLRVHFWFNVLVVLLTVSGSLLAVVATQKQSGNVVFFSDSTHSKAGFSILILVLVHVWAAFFRPSLPKTKRSGHGPVIESPHTVRRDRRHEFAESKNCQPKDGDVDNTEYGDDDDCDTGFESTSYKERRPTAPIEVDEIICSEGDSTWSDEIPPPPPQSASPSNPKNHSCRPNHQSKSMLRRLWEPFHRFVGMTLLGLAWYNCQSGIVILSSMYDDVDQQQSLAAFWTVAGTLSAVIFFLAYVIRT